MSLRDHIAIAIRNEVVDIRGLFSQVPYIRVYPRHPRVRDFKGVSPKGFDGRGNYNMGLKEQIVFPEINYDKVDKLRGMNITICTSSKSDEAGRALLAGLGFPFKKN